MLKTDLWLVWFCLAISPILLILSPLILLIIIALYWSE